VGGQQLALLGRNPIQHVLAAVDLALAAGRLLGQVLLQSSLDTRFVGSAETDSGVVALHRCLDVVDPLRSLWASVPLVG